MRAAGEIYGIVVGGSALLGFAAPSVLELWFNLSALQKVGIGASTFLIALSLMLQIGKPLVKGRASLKEQLKRQSALLRRTEAEKQNAEEKRREAERERNELRAKELNKDTLEKETQELRAEIVRQQEQLNRYDADSLRFRQFLIDAWSEGTDLCGKDPSEEAAADWAGQVRNLLERAMAKHIADTILAHDPQFQSADPDASGAQMFLEMRVQRLENLRKTVANRDAIPFRSGFDPHEWKDWKSPPSTDSEEVEQLKARLREVERERDELRSGEWRQRVENWEAVILDFDFHTDNFASTGTYFDMEDYLRPEVVAMFKGRTFHVGNEAHGDSAYKPALLREIARIKRERGII
jgi:hypothetical protein